MHALIEGAGKKASVAWLATPAGGTPYPVWCVWVEDALAVVTGEGEQAAPGLAEAHQGGATVRVTMRGDHGGRIVTWPATVETVKPDAENWESVATALAGKRLNSPTGTAETVERWATAVGVYKLVPTGEPDEVGATLPDDPSRSPARPSPALRQPKRPKRLHRVRGARKDA